MISGNYRLVATLLLLNTFIGTLLLLLFMHYRVLCGCQFPVEPIVWVILVSLIYYGEMDSIGKYIGVAFTIGEVYFLIKAVITGLYIPFTISVFFGVIASLSYWDFNGVFNSMAPIAVLFTVAVYRKLNLTLGMSLIIAYSYISIYSILLSLVCMECIEGSGKTVDLNNGE